MYKVIFYEDKNGISEVNNYIQQLAVKRHKNKDSKIKFTKITSYIDLLSKHGVSLGKPYVDHLER